MYYQVFLEIIKKTFWNDYQLVTMVKATGKFSGSRTRPDLLFSTPETVGFTHQGVQVDVKDLDITVRQLGISETP